MTPRVCIITAGSLASTPRMLKAADALHEAGYRVRVVCSEHVEWAVTAGAALRAARTWKCQVVHWHPKTGRRVYLRAAVRHRTGRALARWLGPRRLPLPVLARAASPVAPELYRAAIAEPADLVYGGTAGALAPAALAARTLRVPYALDLEDFHSDEQDDNPQARLAHAILGQIERRLLGGAAFLTAGSGPIAQAYQTRYGVPLPVVINNVFPLPDQPPELVANGHGGLKLVWLSQTVGPNRGLEDAVRAMGMAGLAGELHVRGAPVPGYVAALQGLARDVAPRLLVHHHPLDPHRPPEALCRGYDVGLALEQAHVLNRDLCLCNKLFTYMLAGLALACTDTKGQRPLAEDLGAGAVLFKPRDVAALAAGLKRWADDAQALLRAKRACWEAARRRWHWEHPDERGALLAAVGRVLGQ